MQILQFALEKYNRTIFTFETFLKQHQLFQTNVKPPSKYYILLMKKMREKAQEQCHVPHILYQSV